MTLLTFLKNTLSQTRRNHGLEHATLNVLAEKYPGRSFAGHSDPGGFWIWGEIATEELADIILDALSRLRNGQKSLAVHQNCGTNFLVSGTLAGLAGAAGMVGAGKKSQDKLERFPLVIILATLALIFSQPLGPWFQKKITTSGDPGELEVHKVTIHNQPGTAVHRIHTQG
ncbi:MAG: DUF6391 domain-containing protein [Anaerolineales bacterium]|nr:DUF6391 domain-containing protein [Anaerolineales bacterium]